MSIPRSSCQWICSSISEGLLSRLTGFRDEHGEETKQMWAHSGIIGAADAILVDLEANGILEALLQGEEDVSEAAPKNQAAER